MRICNSTHISFVLDLHWHTYPQNQLQSQ
ncbi:MAG: hypothetical protein DRQ03_03820 [Candidatus Hydrothermota bacterium]|nr:MAG: hypothetical protein DRQ03_03820 [Candidatus Hydrothermae bacterium]